MLALSAGARQVPLANSSRVVMVPVFTSAVALFSMNRRQEMSLVWISGPVMGVGIIALHFVGWPRYDSGPSPALTAVFLPCPSRLPSPY
jgi:NO-binding membrane sensor protein with MHYT domain